ncbi:MAG: ABC transporter ATP-binding protein SaoA [Oscillospiraceae bacterium]
MPIVVDHVCKSFPAQDNRKKRKSVLDNVNFEVPDGCFVSLLGPSGCGKSTTLTIIAGFQSKDSGEILVGGKPVTTPGPDRAFVFQDYALLPWLRVGENIAYPMKKQGLSKAEQETRLAELLALAQMEENRNSYIFELSGGMKQRVALLRALACDPKILLMDEPLGAVDFQMRKLLQLQLEAILMKRDITTLMVTHDVEEAVYLSDRVIVMGRDCGNILANVAIDLPRPRDRSLPAYHAYTDQLTELLKQALNGTVYTKEDEDIMNFIRNAEHETKGGARNE